MAYRVKVDKEACVGAGNCVNEEPSGFGFDDDELVSLLPGVDGIDEVRLRSIARDCPAGAIELFDSAGNELEV